MKKCEMRCSTLLETFPITRSAVKCAKLGGIISFTVLNFSPSCVSKIESMHHRSHCAKTALFLNRAQIFGSIHERGPQVPISFPKREFCHACTLILRRTWNIAKSPKPTLAPGWTRTLSLCAKVLPSTDTMVLPPRSVT